MFDLVQEKAVIMVVVEYGYTRVELRLHFQPNGGTYVVTGTAMVNAVRPYVKTTVLNISGTYSPGASHAPLTITGAPYPSTPGFTCTLNGSSLATQMTGMRPLGIYSLYINATAR